MFSAAKTAGPSGYTINNSLRLRASATAYLNRTFGTPTNGKKWTWSAWVKRGSLGSSQYLFGGSLTSQTSYIGFESTDVLQLQVGNGTTSPYIYTTQVFRDPSAWYHIVAVVDTDNATSSNRLLLYINGQQVTALTSSYPTSGFTPNFNTAVAHNLGRGSGTSSSTYFDGYMTEINFIDGQALTPSSFGSTNATTGVWQPKQYTGTYGTNGFYLPFSSIALTSGSNTGLGKDFSGNGNYWNTNNISVTSGTTYDAMIDSPTNASASGTQPVGNYPVMNPVNTYSTVPTAGNLNLSVANLTGGGIVGTMELPTTGKWYYEVTANLTSGGTNTNGPYIGIMPSTISPRNGGTNWYTGSNSYYYTGDGTKVIANVSSAYGSTWTDSTANTYVIGVAYDAGAGTLTMYRNNVSQGTLASGISAIGYYPVSGNAQGSAGACSMIYNFGQRPFSYTPPSGYQALCTTNLPNSTIVKGNSYMDATTYTGNGTYPPAYNIVNAAGFKPDMVWIKSRSNALNNEVFDSVRGTGLGLVTNSTAAEAGNGLVSFNSNGFGLANNGEVNQNAATYVGWQWQAGQGTTSSGTGTGGITSVTQSVNTTAGFSIVTYTGSGANGTVTHGLGVAPKMVIIKCRNAVANWPVYHAALPSAAYYLRLDLTNAQANTANLWNSTAPTSTVFSLGNDSTPNTNGNTYVAYCFAEIAGFSKFGSYTGNNSSDGPFVYLGFRPKFIMIKDTGAVGNWVTLDTSRATYNLVQAALYPNLSNAEDTGNQIDILSNGFKIRQSAVAINQNTDTYIYAAFAENPFKNALAR